MPRRLWIVGIFLITALALSALAQESERRKTVLDGVFTAAQAERGREAYAVHCSTCHSNDLEGLAGPPLKGEQFIDNWREDSVKSLFTFIQTRMPQRAVGSLSAETYIDILSHILSVNMFPAGSNDLNAEALGGIDLVGKDGPAPIPKFALVMTVGCLAKDGDEWILEKVPPPLRTRQEKPIAAEVQASAAKPLGTGTFRLVYLDSLPAFLPESRVGHKLHAQGYLLSNDRGDGLSVTWLEEVDSVCTR
jgi:mono/diheme cytochrome c family protein